MIQDKGRKHWFMIYLTTLVLLFNLEFVYEALARQGIRYREFVINPALPVRVKYVNKSSSRTIDKEQ